MNSIAFYLGVKAAGAPLTLDEVGEYARRGSEANWKRKNPSIPLTPPKVEAPPPPVGSGAPSRPATDAAFQKSVGSFAGGASK